MTKLNRVVDVEKEFRVLFVDFTEFKFLFVEFTEFSIDCGGFRVAWKSFAFFCVGFRMKVVFIELLGTDFLG